MADPASNNNNPAGRQQRAGQQSTVTPLQLYMRHDSRPNESIDIERLLSSSFYPGASSNYNFNDPVPTELPPLFPSSQLATANIPRAKSPSNSSNTIFIPDDDGDSPSLHEVESPDDDASAKNKNKAPAQGKAGGAKRKTDADRSEGPGERRRKQIREAQRAYRQRKISQTAYLEERVKQLESAIENMSSVVLSFSEELIGSNILSCQSELTGRLRDALATCLTLVRETGNGQTEPEPAAGPSSQPNMALVPSIPPTVPNKPATVKNIFGNKPYPDMNTSMAVSDFMDMLATSVVYYGYLALADPTLSTTRLHRHFGLPLQIMTRDKLLSYFSAIFQTRISQTFNHANFPAKPGMPFFSIGGAGTHYSPAFASSSASAPLSLPWANTADQSETWSVRNNAWTVPMDPANVPANMQDRFEGDWFDMQDLELFLIDKGVSLRMMPSKESIDDINVPLFLRGQSPGFRRRDVELAIQAAQCGSQA
ncbi:hypothetical protein HC256_009547 [Beauveria bassiana]|nr:hypothetical protein HC256_009547 [Beauveria bassiana]